MHHHSVWPCDCGNTACPASPPISLTAPLPHVVVLSVPCIRAEVKSIMIKPSIILGGQLP